MERARLQRYKPSLTRLDCFIGGFAGAAIVLHDAAHVLAGRWYDVFWVCNLAALLVGPAVLFRSALLSTVAFTWILPGTLVWFLDTVLAGSAILPTSWGVHLGGSIAAIYGVRRAGSAERGLFAALLLPAFALLISRLFLPASENVNAVHSVPRGWEFLGGSFLAFFAVETLITIALALFGQLAARFIGFRREPRAARATLDGGGGAAD